MARRLVSGCCECHPSGKTAEGGRSAAHRNGAGTFLKLVVLAGTAECWSTENFPSSPECRMGSGPGTGDWKEAVGALVHCQAVCNVVGRVPQIRRSGESSKGLEKKNIKLRMFATTMDTLKNNEDINT